MVVWDRFWDPVLKHSYIMNDEKLYINLEKSTSFCENLEKSTFFCQGDVIFFGRATSEKVF